MFSFTVAHDFTLGDLKAENLLLDSHGNIKVAGMPTRSSDITPRVFEWLKCSLARRAHFHAES